MWQTDTWMKSGKLGLAFFTLLCYAKVAGWQKGCHMDNILKAINLTRYNGESIYLTNSCMSHTNFHQGQVLHMEIYENMILILPALAPREDISS